MFLSLLLIPDCGVQLYVHFYIFANKGQSGYQESKYCTYAAKDCFGNGQNVFVKFNPAFEKAPKVMIGLTLVDTHKDVRIRASVTFVKTSGFWLKFLPWDVSITYQIGVNWMACP